MNFQLQGDASELYERVLVPLWMERWAKTLMETIALRPGDRVLDVACGTGVTTRLAKNHVGKAGHVDGLDNNPGMLSKAKELALNLDISWIISDVCGSGLPSGHYDAIISQHGFHYFPEKSAALKEFHRLLVSGGRLAFSVWDGPSPYTEALCSAVEKHISPEVARTQRSQRETLSGVQLAQMVVDEGFSDVTSHRQELMIRVPSAREFVPQHLGSMPIANAFRNLSDSKKESLISDVEEAMQKFSQDDQLVYPDAVNVVLGFK